MTSAPICRTVRWVWLVVLRLPVVLKGLLVGALVLAMLVFGVRQPVEFFYFQF